MLRKIANGGPKYNPRAHFREIRFRNPRGGRLDAKTPRSFSEPRGERFKMSRQLTVAVQQIANPAQN
jgi:hypothetical protein